MNKNHYIISRNSLGDLLVKHRFHWSIYRPLADQTSENTPANHVYHTGKKEYINKIWKDRFAGR